MELRHERLSAGKAQDDNSTSFASIRSQSKLQRIPFMFITFPLSFHHVGIESDRVIIISS